MQDILIKISLKTGISEYPPLFLNDYNIPKVNSTNILGVKVLTHGKQRLGQLHRCRNFFNHHDLSILYKSWVRPTIEYGYVLYSGASPSHLHCLNTLQTCVEHMSSSKFSSLCNRRNAAIMGLVCHLLAGEGQGNLLTFCPKFVTNTTRRSQRLYYYDPANHLRFQNPCDFRSLRRSFHT